MAEDLYYRTEDIRPEDILNLLVETGDDRAFIDALKGRSPVVLRGSRGVGKSFLLRAAEAELIQTLPKNRVLPVYLTFAKASLIKAPTPDRFMSWMIAKMCNRIIRAASQHGLDLPSGSSIKAIRGGEDQKPSRMEEVERIFEESWKEDSDVDDPTVVPDPEVLRDAVEDLCRHTGLKRICLFVDEAAHVFLPEQQRQFFTLMRDLRSPYLSVKAAVYPGATAFGESFQLSHDATLLSVDRAVTEDGYAVAMREIVYKQDENLRATIERNGDVFDTLAYAATGNPRVLLKTLARSDPFNRRNVQETIREYYREGVWSEHSGLAERYPGHRDLIDWGRQFVEQDILPSLYRRNQAATETSTSSYIWIHRDAPVAVREALRLLCYSGILQEGVSGIRGTRSEMGTRYMVNLGCQFALDAEPVTFGSSIRKSLSVRRMTEYGSNNAAYRSIESLDLAVDDAEGNQALEAQLSRSSDVLDLTLFQKSKLVELGLSTIGAVLASDEEAYKKAYMIGKVRARQMRNAAVAAVLEYLSG